MTRSSTLLLSLLLIAGCAKSLDPGDKDDTGSASEVSAGEAVINATSQTDWVYLDLESAQMVSPATPADSTEWDLAFRRYKVALNGGVSGTGGMEAVPMPGVDYNTDLEAPTSGWITDEPDADGDGDMEYALDSWFDYDSATHEVTPAETIFVLRTVEGGLTKFEFLAYYDEAGTPAYIHVHWGPLSDDYVEDTGDTDTTPDGPVCTTDSSRSITTEADGVFTTQAYTGDEEEIVCFSFGEGGLVSEGWDMSMVKWTWPSTAEVAELEGQDFDALTNAPADGWVSDPDLEGDCFESWYDYDSTEHILVPFDKVYVVHTADAYYKMQVTTYYPEGDHDQPHWPTWRWAPIEGPAR